MENFEVDKILEVLNSTDCENYFDYPKEYYGKYKRYNISKISEFKFVRELINKDLSLLNENYEVSDFISLLKYVETDFFGRHKDVAYTNQSNKKVVKSGIYLLNKDFTGGEFLLENEIIPLDIGEIFLFNRTMYHEVKKITSGTRYSLHFAVIEKNSTVLI